MEYIPIFVLASIYLTVKMFDGFAIGRADPEKGSLVGCITMPLTLALPLYLIYLLNQIIPGIMPAGYLLFLLGEFGSSFYHWCKEGRFDPGFKRPHG